MVLEFQAVLMRSDFEYKYNLKFTENSNLKCKFARQVLIYSILEA